MIRSKWLGVCLASVVSAALVSPAWAGPETGNDDPSAKPAKKRKEGKEGRPQTGMADRLFGQFDPDGDGKIVVADLPSKVAERVGKLDKDKDGNITRKELGAGRPEGSKPSKGADIAKRFGKMDTNGDGKLEGDEIPAGLKKNMARIDSNGDGVIEQSELEKLRRPAAIEGGPKPKGERPQGQVLLERLKMFDSDGDGKIKIDDLPEPARRLVGRADTDADGVITFDEVKKFSAADPTAAGGRGQAAFSPETLLENFDGNADGKLSKEELAAIPNLPIERLDGNGDGELTKEEIDSKMKLLQRVAEMRKGKGKGPGGEAAAGGKGDRARRLFDSQDANADGRVSKEEAKGPLAEKFDSLDKNKDNQLDEPEVANGLAGEPKKGKDGEPKKEAKE